MALHGPSWCDEGPIRDQLDLATQRGGLMEIAKVNGVELEYEVVGSGEPTLLIDMLIADCFVPILQEPSLDRYQLIRYHKRGWVGSTHTPPPVSIADHADDAAA